MHVYIFRPQTALNPMRQQKLSQKLRGEHPIQVGGKCLAQRGTLLFSRDLFAVAASKGEAEPPKDGSLQAAQGGGETGLWTDQRGERLSEIFAARTGERGGGVEADLRHTQPAEAFPLRMESAERLKAQT